MLGKVMLLDMFNYNHRTNILLLDRVANVIPIEWDSIEEASLHEKLFHMITAEYVWLYLCTHKKPKFDFYNAEAHASIAKLRAFADQTYDMACSYLAGVEESDLTATVFAKLPDDLEHDAVIWRILIHVLYHSTQHRSEVAALLTSHNLSPGDIDYFDYMWE